MIHLIHSSILALFLYLLYKLVIQKSQGFQTRRFYLLAIPVVSFVLPLMVVPVDFGLAGSPVFTPAVVDSMMVEVVDSSKSTTAVTQPNPIDISQILGIIYLVGLCVSLILFLYKLAQIQQWKESGKTAYQNGTYVTRVHGLPSAFSFLNSIYISDAFAKAEYQQILEHEKVHVNQKHSWDLLFFETLRVIFWFHPVSYLGQRELKLVHEFIADQKTIEVHGKKSYYENLLKQVMDCPDFSFANPFFKSKTIKTRLAMIQNNNPQKFNYLKLLWILPILFASLIYTACSTEQEVIKVEQKTYRVDELPTLQEHIYGQIDFYKGVTAEEMEILEKGIEIMKQYLSDDTSNEKSFEVAKRMLRDPNLKEYRRVTKKISDNGKTIVRDIENNNYVLTIQESENGSPTFTGTGPIDQLNMSNDEISSYLKNLHEKYGKADDVTVVTEVEVVEEKYDMQKQAAVVPFAIIENVPTYPGCSGDNAEKKKCMQQNITQLVKENFDTSIASRVGLNGKQTISVQFKIDQNGNVANIISRAKAPELQAEAARVVNLLPKMQPGTQRGHKVGVIYGLPIIFNVPEESKKEE
ncbi:Signal transducer regulating beta-lactamase production, contains metallopeptidase domain [Nonlabens sp. Hel1_33_55]|uniref:M56 family metallopeptidase n=1 Tax=Nonlabens sp. Hel1_33_55 TaxID=1336802 RepID=UPI000875C210|nr:M56 family metallopeptidase [Nonlabens sp. Hel1_33_55]SCX95596.1 Signal transducer regulating beta-lactamase production, contains metallopeptidase domain [Nonlabens sp. Hel1_33_55]